MIDLRDREPEATPWEVVEADAVLAGAPLPPWAALNGVRARWAALCAAPGLAGLAGLGVAHAGLTAEALLPLARRADLASIRALRLDGNRIDGAGLAKLLATPLFAGLHVLELSDNPLDPMALAQIAAAAPRLTRLGLSGVGLDQGTLARPLPALRRLDLSRNRLGSAGAGAVLAALDAPLEVVDLAATGLDVAVRIPGPLVALGLGRNPLAGAEIARMIAAAHASLRWLDAARTASGDGLLAGLAALALPALRGVDAEVAAVTDAGVAALVAGTLPALERLGLARNPISEGGGRALAAWRGAPRLARCDLEGCPISPAAARALVAASPRLRFEAEPDD